MPPSINKHQGLSRTRSDAKIRLIREYGGAVFASARTHGSAVRCTVDSRGRKTWQTRVRGVAKKRRHTSRRHPLPGRMAASDRKTLPFSVQVSAADVSAGGLYLGTVAAAAAGRRG